jgi:hypothetical protein
MARLSRFRSLRAAHEITDPRVTRPTGVTIDDTTATGTVYLKVTSADNDLGDLYYYASESAFESEASIEANGASQAVTANGINTVTFTGLTASTVYYPHYLFKDRQIAQKSISGESTFTTEAGGGGGFQVAWARNANTILQVTL